jgi:hypothetical protein
MTTLGELSRLIRSKNAGPFELTFDIMFDDEATYRRVLSSRILTKESFAALYRLPVTDVRLLRPRRRRLLWRPAARPAGRARAAGLIRLSLDQNSQPITPSVTFAAPARQPR